MLLLLFIVLGVYSDENDCIWNVDGKTYDLSPLKGKSGRGNDKKVQTYEYDASVCSDMTETCQDIMTGHELTGCTYQFGGQPGGKRVCWDVLGFWKDVTAATLDSSAPEGKTGFSLKFANGDACRNAPRKLTMNMLCDTQEIGTLEGWQDTDDSCHFIINFPTTHACGGGPAPPHPTKKPTHPDPGHPPPKPATNNGLATGGIGAGDIFIIVFLVIFVLYCAGFFFWNGRNNEEDGYVTKDNLPHMDFWTRMTGYVKDGCLKSWEWTKLGGKWCLSKCKRGEQDSDGEYLNEENDSD